MQNPGNEEAVAGDAKEDYKFKFPPPPRLSKSDQELATGSLTCNYSSDTGDTDNSDTGFTYHSRVPTSISSVTKNLRHKRRPLGYHSDSSPAPKVLPPIGVFWDIENCQVPKGRTAVSVAQLVRDLFFIGFREAEFIVVCDVKKETNQVIQELNDAQVNLIHVSSTCKNAADEKLRQCMRRFADTHGAPAAIVLISGDINFAADLSDLRHRKKIHVILVHNQNTSEALIVCANETHCFTELTESLPPRARFKASPSPPCVELLVWNLPLGHDSTRLRSRLKQISNNCGGKVAKLDNENGTAVMRFAKVDSAVRAQKRMDGEDVYGHKISVGHPGSLNVASNTSIPRLNWNSPKNARKSRRELDLDEGYQTMVSASWSGDPSIPMPPMPQFGPGASSLTQQWNNQSQPFSRQYSNNSQEQTAFYGGAYKSDGRQSPVTGLIQPNVLNPYSTCNQSSWLADQTMKAERWIPNKLKNSSFAQKSPDGSRKGKGTQNGPTGDPVADSRAQRIQVPPSRGLSNSTILKGRLTGSGTLPKTFDANVRRARTPSPWQRHPISSSFVTNSINADFENCFQPIRKNDGGPIELQVSNLDQSIDAAELRKILLNVFREHVPVINVTVFPQSDGNMFATVKVPTIQDAQFAIFRLHRRRVGYKRLLISYTNSTTGPDPQLIRAQIVSLLQEVPGHSLPLFKFRESFESRYLNSISMSELYRLRDVCIIGEDPLGRTVSLHPDHRNTPSPCFSGGLQENGLPQELPFCLIHCPPGQQQDKGWAEQEMEALPNVRIGLKELKANLYSLLESHNGCLPLPSLAVCYEAQLGKTLNVDDSGVPLEHLASCIEGVEIRQGLGTTKQLVWAKDRFCDSSEASVTHTDDSSTGAKCVSPPLATQLALFSRELVDLLRKSPKCQLLFHKFIPAYHHHFGRQCRVADYGFTKLIDLMEALTQTVQVMGEGNKRVITLSHKAQLRRFTSDLLRVLKSQASKQLLLSELPELFEKCLGRVWDVVEFGVCEVNDLLLRVNENTVLVTTVENDYLISIPKREQTVEEIERTTKFGKEVIELLKHAPQCAISFNKFVPSYHHHFGHQCRVSDYGFTKLIELFDSIPDIVKIEESADGERKVCLTLKYGLIVLGEQLENILRNAPSTGVHLDAVVNDFLKQFGYTLKPDMFECGTFTELLSKIPQIKLSKDHEGAVLVSLADQSLLTLGLRAWTLLKTCIKMQLQTFVSKYASTFGDHSDIYKLNDIEHIVQITKPLSMTSTISLTPIYEFAANAFVLFSNNNVLIPLHVFEHNYLKQYGKPIVPSQYGYQSLNGLIAGLPEIFIKRHKGQKGIALNPNLATYGVAVPLVLSNSELSCNTVSDSIGKSHQTSNGFHQIEQNTNNYRVTSNTTNITGWYDSTHNRSTDQLRNGQTVDNNITLYENHHAMMKNHFKNVATSNFFQENQKISNNIESEDLVGQSVNTENSSIQNICIDNIATSVSDQSGGSENSVGEISANGNYVKTLQHPVGPPKPDTPPSNQESLFWGNTIWGPQEEIFNAAGYLLQIEMPPTSEKDNGQLDELAKSLISPTLSLLQASDNPTSFQFNSSPSSYQFPPMNNVQPPPTSLLPKPTPDFVSPQKNLEQKEYTANGESGSNTPSRSKRKSRLAAYFMTPMED